MSLAVKLGGAGHGNGLESDPALELRGITKVFGHVQALRGVNFSVIQGEVMALVGDNGAGKSTLIKVISGAHRPSGGEMLLDGKAVVFANPGAATNAGI